MRSAKPGWISPVVIARGRVAGVWEMNGGTVTIKIFEEAGPVAHEPLASEMQRLATFLGRELRDRTT